MDVVKDLLLIVLAPAGIWFGWYLQRKDKLEERAQRRKELLRQKAEQIYEEIEAAFDRGAQGALAALAVTHGSKRDPQTMKAFKIDKLVALLRMYFPDIEEPIVEYDTSRFSHLKEHNAKLKDLHKEPIAENLQKMKELEYELACVSNEDLINCLTKVRHAMNRKVGTLT